MDAVTLAAANAAAAKKYAALSVRTPPVPGVPLTDGCYGQQYNVWTMQTSAGTSRTLHRAAFAASDLRLVYVNYANNGSTGTTYQDADAAAALPVKASIKFSGVIYPVTFRGALTVSIDPGGYVVSDPLPIEVSANTDLEVLTYTSSTSWRANRRSTHSSGSGGFSASDLTATGSAAVADSFGYLIAPALITGVPTTTPLPRSVAVLGDSIAAGVGDDTSGDAFAGYNASDPLTGGGGFIYRALRGNYGFSVYAIPGDGAAGYAIFSGHFRRRTHLQQFTDALCEYGRNDLTLTLAQTQANLVRIWKDCYTRGLRAWQTTITPRSTSTDGWATAAGQTADSTNALRVQLNNWLRDGAPLNNATSLTAVATGTSGALRAGQTGHPLAGYFEVADLTETARDSGLWKSANRVVTDAAITTGTGTLTSATAAFVSGDYGRHVSVVGAGSAGGVLIAQISGVTSATQVSLRVNASTTVSGATAGVGISTADGLHPTTVMHGTLAAAIPAKAFG